MPSLNRRREVDSRNGRFESEIRVSDMNHPGFQSARKFMCEKCHRMFEEKSRVCPRCDTHSMGELRPIPSQFVEEARRNAVKRAKAGIVRSD